MSSTTEARVAVITGGSSGIGLHAARALRGRGLNVLSSAAAPKTRSRA